MSDSGKEHKLAAARSKLQQFRNRRSRVKDAIKAASASGGCSGAESQASTELSSRASSYDPLNDADHLEVTSLVAPPQQQDTVSAPVASLGASDAMDFCAEVLDNLGDRSGANSASHPAYRSAASLFASTQSSSADDFLADSVRFANGDASFPQSTSIVSSSGGVTVQQSSQNFTTISNTSTSLSNSNGVGRPLINIVSNYFSSSNNGQSSFPNLSSSETTAEKPVTFSNTTGDRTMTSNPTSGSQDFSIRSCERDSSLESIRSAATAIHQPQLAAAAGGTALQGSDVVMQASPSTLGDKNSAASLREISKQLQGLVNEADSTGPIDHREEVGRQSEESREQIRMLEARNMSLADQLQQHKLLITQQQGQLQELSSMLQESHAQVADAATSAAESSSNKSFAEEELAQVRQQLHVHVQTISILVAEKTQLESQLHEAREQLSGRGDQGREAETKLAAARRRIEEVEAALTAKEAQVTALATEKEGLQSQLQLAKEEKDRFKLRCSDHELRAAELAERMSSSSKDQHSLQAQITETKTQLHMANIRVEQLRNSSGDSANILDELNQEKRAHQAAQDQLCEVRQELAQAQAEKNQVAAQYQLYTNQLSQQTQQIREQLVASEQERQQLQRALEEQQQRVEELQKQLLQHQQSAEKDSLASSAQQLSELQEQLQRMDDQAQKLNAELQETRDNNKRLEDNNLSLHQLSEQLQQQVERLELALDKRQTESVDSSGLLAKLQSDKVAAARALAQNRMLKEQLAELQDGFVLMSNKKLELTEKLERELHLKKGLNKQLNEAVAEAKSLRDASGVRETEVQQLRESCSALASQLAAIKQRDQLQLLENQRQQQQQLDPKTTVQLGEKSESVSTPKEKVKVCEDALLNGVGESNKDPSSPNEEVNSNQEALACEESSSMDVGGLEVGDKTLTIRGGDSDQSSNDTSSSVMTESISSSDGRSSNDSMDSPAGRCALLEYRLAQLSSTHSALVGRFQRAMKQVAELTEENQRLEVTMEQLELENDTIGDYITIYQFKRGVMSQQMREKDLELDRLRGDRQTLIEKLAELQKLMQLLVEERGTECGGLASAVNTLLTAVTREVEIDEMDASKSDGSTEGSKGDPSVGELQSQQLELTNGQVSISGSVSRTGEKKDAPKSETVTRIMSLIKEMEEAPTVDPRSLHPCGMCSGNLITV
ncbi:Golgin subfamily A [Trinorchestia longiramus]|nr:Golgin subfamily A [Trinorchestia longiramus]